MPAAPTYWDYLQLDQLLTLQGGVEGEESDLLADELHFILVHQNFELWFKLLLSEIRLARDHLGQPKVDEGTIPYVVQHLRRINAVLRHCVNQFEVVETLTPQGFLDFRDKLVPASGFQSFQVREVEILMGLEDSARVRYAGIDPLAHIQEVAHDTPAGRLATARIAGVRRERTMVAVLDDWLYRTPIQGSSPGSPDDDAVVRRFLDAYLARMSDHHAENLDRLVKTLSVADPDKMTTKFETIQAQAASFLMGADVDEAHQPRVRRIRAAALFIESYRDLPLLSWPRLLLDLVVEMEEQLVLFRHRHARMVERTIGRRIGTGGSGGVDYLDETGRYRVFRDLWAVRTILLPKARLPDLEDVAFYAFSAS